MNEFHDLMSYDKINDITNGLDINRFLSYSKTLKPNIKRHINTHRSKTEVLSYDNNQTIIRSNHRATS